MRSHPLLTLSACVCLLAGCATDTVAPAAPAAPPTLARLVSDADTASAAGQYDKAYALLKSGTLAYPADKTPWLRMAQLRYDRGQYSDAIGSAVEVLRRDPDDKQANGLVALSGLRLSTKALADLTRKNNVSAPLRTEARDLARLLRANLGDEVAAAPPGAPAKGGRASAAKAVREAAAGKGKAAPAGPAADPFGGLK